MKTYEKPEVVTCAKESKEFEPADICLNVSTPCHVDGTCFNVIPCPTVFK